MAEYQNRQRKLKVVVRNLPSNLTETQLIEVVKAYRGAITYFYFAQGKVRSRVEGTRRGAAWIRFSSSDALYDFVDAVQGHVFTDDKGESLPAQVEFALSQDNIRPQRRPDKLNGKIETDAAYMNFLSSLNNKVEALPSAERQFEAKENKLKELAAEGKHIEGIPAVIGNIKLQQMAGKSRTARRTAKKKEERKKAGGKKKATPGHVMPAIPDMPTEPPQCYTDIRQYPSAKGVNADMLRNNYPGCVKYEGYVVPKSTRVLLKTLKKLQEQIESNAHENKKVGKRKKAQIAKLKTVLASRPRSETVLPTKARGKKQKGRKAPINVLSESAFPSLGPQQHIAQVQGPQYSNAVGITYGPWSCGMCTFVNGVQAMSCAMCNAPKTSGQLQPQQYQQPAQQYQHQQQPMQYQQQTMQQEQFQQEQYQQHVMQQQQQYQQEPPPSTYRQYSVLKKE